MVFHVLCPAAGLSVNSIRCRIYGSPKINKLDNFSLIPTRKVIYCEHLVSVSGHFSLYIHYGCSMSIYCYLSLPLDLCHELLPLTPDIRERAVTRKTEADLRVREDHTADLFNAFRAAACEPIHIRPSHFVSTPLRNHCATQNQRERKCMKGDAQSTPCAPSAIALRMSLPVRIPESKRIVNVPACWASRIASDWQILSSA